MPEEGPKGQVPYKILLIAIAIGILGDWMFHGTVPGLSFPIFVGLFYLCFFLAGGKDSLPRSAVSWLLLILVLGLATTFAIFTNEVFRTVNYVLIPLLVAAHASLLRQTSRNPWPTPAFLIDSLHNASVGAAANALALGPVLRTLAAKGERDSRKHTLRKVVQGLGLSVPVLLLILPLLWSADAVFQVQVADLLSSIPNLATCALIVGVVAVYSFGLLSGLRPSAVPASAGAPELRRSWNPITVATLLLVLNGVYLVFVAIQFVHLFGQDRGGLPADLSYSEYARQGFFQLLAVSVINLSVLLACALKAGRDGPVALWSSRALMLLLIACSVVIMLSAHHRLVLYEEAYGLTRLRLLSHLFLVLLLLLFSAGLAQVFLRRLFLHKIGVVAALLFYLALNYLNIDAFITRYNVGRLAHTSEFDVSYHVYDLSQDGTAELIDALPRLDEPRSMALRSQLCLHLAGGERDADWRSYNYHQRLAAELIEGVCTMPRNGG